MSADVARPQSSRERGLTPVIAGLARQAQAALLDGRFSDAQRVSEEALRQMPQHPELLRLCALARAHQGEAAHAIVLLRAAADHWPEDALIHCNLGAVLAQQGELETAIQVLRRATELDPRLVDAWQNLAHALDRSGDAAGAYVACSAALQRDHSRRSLRLLRAQTLTTLGRIEAAEAELRGLVRDDAQAADAWMALANLKALRADGNDLHAIGQLYAASSSDQRIGLGFAYANVLEMEDRYAEAFDVLQTSNAAKREHIAWDAAAVSRLVDDILAAFAQPPAVVTSTRTDALVFLVGMPRSGSTLAEQILCAHPHVIGGGETNAIAQVLHSESKRRGVRFPRWVDVARAQDWTRLGDAYRARIASARHKGSVFVDKTLPNWQMLGAIARMLPEARFVHCRRHRLETCWSCYKHLFDEGQGFSYDFADLARFYHDCERAMTFWHGQMDDAIYCHVYEDLIEQPEASVRALLTFGGLDFDPACLRFNEVERDVHTASAAQVRRPLRGDLTLASRYGELLDPLRRELDRTWQ